MSHPHPMRPWVLAKVQEASLIMIGDSPADPNRTIEITNEIMQLVEDNEAELRRSLAVYAQRIKDLERCMADAIKGLSDGVTGGWT